MILDGKDIGILVCLWEQGSRAIELPGDFNDNKRRLYRLRRAGLCGCSPQQGWKGHREHIWGINPEGKKVIALAETDYAGVWRKFNWFMKYHPKRLI